MPREMSNWRDRLAEWQSPPLLPTGTVVDGRYVVVREISSGGFGVVFEVKSADGSNLPSAMALKCMKNPPASEADAERFRCEVKFLKEIKNDECFPRFFGEGELVDSFKDAHPYYVMELLAPVVMKGDVLYPGADDGTRAKCLLEVLDAVEVMHRAGYVHEDIKPANIMRRAGTGRHVLVDFGTVHKINGADDCNPGSPGYLAPEKGHGVGRDIFAIGQVIRDMFPERVPIKWNLIINKCISRLPKYRYANVDELRQDITNIDELGRQEMEQRILEWRMQSIEEQRRLVQSPRTEKHLTWDELKVMLDGLRDKVEGVYVGKHELLIDFRRLGCESITVSDAITLGVETSVVIKGLGVLRADISPLIKERRVITLLDHATLIDTSKKLPQARDIVYCIGEHCYVNLKNITKGVAIPESSYRLSSAGDSFIRCGGPDAVGDIVAHTDGVLWSGRRSLFGVRKYKGRKGLTSHIWDADSDDGRTSGIYLKAMGVQYAGVLEQLSAAFGNPMLFAAGQNGQSASPTFPLGAIVGAICGSWYTHHPEKDLVKVELFHEPSRLPVDGEMTLAIAAALCGCNGDPGKIGDFAQAAMRIMGRATPFSFGKRFRDWVFDDDYGPYGSWGNGAVMRVSPCAWAAQDLAGALELAQAVTNLTHNSDEGVTGAKAVTEAIFLAREMSRGKRPKSKTEICEAMGKYYVELRSPDFTIDNIRPEYAYDESCQQCVPQAIRAFHEANSFEDAIKLAISLGGDADTLAAVSGAIAEAYYGIPDGLRMTALGFLDTSRRRILKAFGITFKSRCDEPLSCNADR